MMKKLAYLLLLAPLAFTTAFANPDSGQGPCKYEGKQRFMERMAKDLQLTPEQSDQVLTILKEQHEKMRAQREAMRKQMEPMREALHAETRDKLAGVLNEEQLQMFDQKHEEMRAKREERRGKWKNRMDKEEEDDDDDEEKE